MFFLIGNTHVCVVDKTKVPYLFCVAITKSKDFKRGISCFRTAQGVKINLYTYPKGDPLPWIAIVTEWSRDGFLVEESYRLVSDGSCTIDVSTEFRSATKEAIRRTKSEEKYGPNEFFRSAWLRGQLDVLATWLTDKETVRVDPYDPNRILGDDDDDVDRLLATNIAVVDDFVEKLEKIELTPGIHTIE
jgi:hypothetical protein